MHRQGRPLEIYGLLIASPFPASYWLHESIELAHKLAGNVFLPLVVLHVLGALKHALVDKQGAVARRMFVAVDNGR